MKGVPRQKTNERGYSESLEKHYKIRVQKFGDDYRQSIYN